jgi:hypothetical protein
MRGTPVSVGGRLYEVIPDLVGQDRVFVIAAVTDDADGRAMAREVTLASSEPLVFTAQSDREVALAGNPHLAFIDRSLPHTVAVTLRAEGYRTLGASVTIPAFAPLPHRQDFAPRRLPFTLTGRVYGRTAGPTPSFEPLPGATVALSPLPAPGGELPLLLRQPLRADPGAGATIRRRGLAAEAPLNAVSEAVAGEAFLAVADGTGVAAGQVLRVGPAHRRFYGEIAQVIAHPDLAAPAALIRLTEGLVGTIRAGTAIERFAPGGFSGSTGNFVGAAFAGEAVLWLDALPAAGGVLVVREAGRPDRYHDADALTGPAGDYLVEGIARIGEPTLEVGAAGFTTKATAYRVARLGAGPLDWYLVP